MSFLDESNLNIRSNVEENNLVFDVWATRLMKKKLKKYSLLSTNDNKSQAVERDREQPGL